MCAKSWGLKLITRPLDKFCWMKCWNHLPIPQFNIIVQHHSTTFQQRSTKSKQMLKPFARTLRVFCSIISTSFYVPINVKPKRGWARGGWVNHGNLILRSVPREVILILHDFSRVEILIVCDQGLKDIWPPSGILTLLFCSGGWGIWIFCIENVKIPTPCPNPSFPLRLIIDMYIRRKWGKWFV